MHTIYWWSLSLLLLCCSGVSSASSLSTFTASYSSVTTSPQSSAASACSKLKGMAGLFPNYTAAGVSGSGGGGACIWRTYSETLVYYGTWSSITTSCPFGDNGSSCNASCDLPNVMEGGQCITPINECAAGSGTSTGWKKTWPSFDAYNSDPGKPKCTTSQNGCSVDICSENGTSECGQDGLTGQYACFGNGTYTGDQQDASEGGDVDGCEGAACQPPPPVTSSSQQSCTPNVNGSFTCVKNDVSSQFSGSECTVGSVGGSTGYVCVKPDYVPQSHDKTTQDVVTETTNPDGSKTTVTETTTNHTTCKAGACTTTTTTTTTTNGTNPDGSPGDSSTVCTGDKCDNPATDKDESKEEESEEEVERTASGGDCSASLSCEGDAIDCAVLEQQKLMRCSMDWETQKGAVIAEAGKAEYQLQTDEIDVGDLFSGPSAARWLTASCPADRSIYLSLTGSSITFSWQFICDYASGLGNLLVALASLFFAVYVGRAFGGS